MTFDATVIVLALVAGFLVCLALIFVWKRAQAKTAQDMYLNLAKEKLAAAREGDANELDTKKALIDQQLQQMNVKLDGVSTKLGQLDGQLQTSGQLMEALTQTTSGLREVLSSSQKRGDWGQRMAEDVLRLAGFIENVNYLKQKTIEGVGTRPDFTFLLPKGLKLHMDVKFPLDNYLRFLEAEAEGEKDKFLNDFLRDVRARIKELTTRDYIDAESNTVDCVLLFIPNEQVYAFIHEHDSSILDEGIKKKVVSCSPITLFPVLAVIRQAVGYFALERTSNDIQSLFGAL